MVGSRKLRFDPAGWNWGHVFKISVFVVLTSGPMAAFVSDKTFFERFFPLLSKGRSGNLSGSECPCMAKKPFYKFVPTGYFARSLW